MMIEHCIKHDLKVVNTFYQKSDEHLMTYRGIGINGPPYVRIEGKTQRYETLDYMTTEDRWKNIIQDIESKEGPFIETNHYPIVAKIKITMKSLTKNNKQDKQFKQILKPDDEEWKNYNSALYAKGIKMNANEEDNEQLMKAALGNLPVEPERYEIAIIPEHIKELEKKAKETSRTTHQIEHDKIVKQLGNEYQNYEKNMQSKQ